jgi:hypothetical protein
MWVGQTNASQSFRLIDFFTEFKATDDHSRRTHEYAKAQALTQSGETLIAEEIYPLLHQFRSERSGVALTKKGAHHAQIGRRLINITENGVAASHRSVRCDWVTGSK